MDGDRCHTLNIEKLNASMTKKYLRCINSGKKCTNAFMNAKRVLSQQWREKSLKVIKSKWKLADVTTTTKKFADLIIMLKTFAISMAFTRKSKCTNMKVDKQMWICETRKLPEKKARRRWRKRKKTKNAQLWASYKYALKGTENKTASFLLIEEAFSKKIFFFRN